MSEADPETINTARGLPLTPLDEAHLARAQTLSDLADAALDGLTQRATQPGAAFLSGAQELLALAQRLVDEAAVIHRERGESWEEIGDQAGISRQSAHDRWNDRVAAWALVGRRRTGINATPADTLLPNLDAWFQQYDPRPQPISATVASFNDPEARIAAQQQREEAAQLRPRAEDPTATRETWVAYTAAVGTDAADEKRAAWAAAHLARADLYDRLAAAEGPMGAEAKRTAGKQRSIAQEILAGRRDAQPLQPLLDTFDQINAAWEDLSPEERLGPPKVIAEHMARRLDGVSAATVAKHLHRFLWKTVPPLPIDVSAARDEAVAHGMAQHLVGHVSAFNFWGETARTLLTGYLVAAALDDGSLATVRKWAAHPDEDSGVVELLRTGCAPESSLPARVEQILTAHPHTRDGALVVVAQALQDATER